MYVKLLAAAKILGISEYSLRLMVRRGFCPAVMIGGKYYLNTDEVQQILHEQSLQNLRPSEGLTD